jgi:GGDEF domain-containing protein
VADAQSLLASARDQCYLDPLAARESGRALAACDGALAAWGWLHVALAEVRVGEASASAQAVAKARQAFEQAADTRGLLWCDEVEAILLRRTGDYAGSARRQALLDAQPEHAQAQADDPLLGFVAHNSRAITAKLQGQIDECTAPPLRSQRRRPTHKLGGPAHHGAGQSGWLPPRSVQPGRCAQAQREALAAGREAGARQSVTTVAVNLILIYHALGEVAQARAMAEFVLTHQDELVPDAVNRYALPLALGHLGVGEIPAATACLEAGAVAGVADGDGMVMWAWLKARCLLAQGDAKQARAVAERTLQQRRERRLSDPPYEIMELQRALADACESLGDSAAALACMRQAHKGYEQLVGRSARARYIALDVGHQLAQAQRERDMAVVSHRSADDDRRRLSELNTALQAQIAETEMLHAKLREQALRDPLTGLHNRRYLFEMAPALLELARRQGQPLCVVLLDLDHFKLLNDTYGHHAGDLVLQRFALLLTQILRRSDVVCRHGGEEFVAVMPDIDAEGTQAVLGALARSLSAKCA